MAELERKDIISDEALQAPAVLAENFRKLITTMDSVRKSAADVVTTMGSGKTSAEGQRKAVDELQRAQNRLNKANDVAAKEVAKLNVQIREKNKQNQIEAKQSLGLIGAYDRLNKELNEARVVYKNLAASGTASTKVLKEQEAIVNRLDRRVKVIDNTVGQFQRNVGNYPKTFGIAAGAVKNFIAAFGVIGGIQLLATVIKDVISTFKEFTKANSTLKAISGATRAELKLMTEQQKALSLAMGVSATSLAEAQTELSRLGFSVQDILKITPAILNAARALEVDFASAAELVAGQLNAFGLGAESAQQVVDNLVSAANIGAFDFERLATSLGNVSPAAKAVGASLSDTLAILGAAVDANIDASTAGSSLRNIYIDLAAKGITWNEAMARIQGSTDKLSTANELFGKRGALVATVIADNTEKIEESKKRLDEQGVAARVAAEQMDNLSGDASLLTFAWESLILAFTTGSSVFSNVTRGVVQLITQFLKWIQTSQTVVFYIKASLAPLLLLVRAWELLSTAFDRINTGSGDRLVKFFRLAIQPIKDFFKFLANLPDILTGVVLATIETFNIMREAAVNSFTLIKDVIKAAFDPTQSIAEVVSRAVKSTEDYGARIAAAYQRGFNKFRAKETGEEDIADTGTGTAKKKKVVVVSGEKELTKEIIAESELRRKGRIAALERQQKEATDIFAKELEAFKKQREFEEGINKRFNERMVDDAKKRSEHLKDIEKQQTKDFEEQQARKQAILDLSFQLGFELANGLADARIDNLQRESDALEDQREKELEAAGDDERKKLAINRRFDREQAKIKRKQAVADKLAAIFNIGIGTAQNIIKVFPNPVLIALASALGAIQTAFVLGRKIPEFFRGTKSSPSTFVAGDRGRELLISKNKVAVTPDKSTLYRGMPGTRIIPHDQTEEILGTLDDARLPYRFTEPQINNDETTMIHQDLVENNSLLKQLINKPVPSWVMDSLGFREFIRRGSSRNENINKRFGSWLE